jgi:hypothetical protein
MAIIAAMVLSFQYISLARQNQILKTDLAEINHVRYDLLNAEHWGDQLATILTIKILEFQLTPESRERVIENLENVLYMLIDDVEEMVTNQTTGRFPALKNWLAGITINLDFLRDSVPSYALQILDELGKPENKYFIQQFLFNKLNEFAETTYNLDQMLPLENVMERYDCINKEVCKERIRDEIELVSKEINLRVILIIALAGAVFLLNLATRKKINMVQATLLILASFCLLLGGVTTPMIDLEAKIDQLMLQLMGEKITFLNNIIFFQSKSITDVVRILFEEGTLPMIFVGVLVFTFSIIFPAIKLISSLLYAYRIGNLRENRLIRFFVIKSGKWSMADVMVVAIFMAFVGFDGIISNQLDQLKRASEHVHILTTNGTQLLSAFYLFLLFCISSLLLSEIITRKT